MTQEGLQFERCGDNKVLFKLDQQIFRRSLRNTCKQLVRKGECAYDVVLLDSTGQPAEATTRTYIDEERAIGFTVSLQKKKFMVVGHGTMEEEKTQLSTVRDRTSVSVSSRTWNP